MGSDALDRAQRLLGTLEVAQRLGIWEWVPATDEMVWSDGMFDLLGVAPDAAPSVAGLLAVLHASERPLFESQLAQARRQPGLLAFRCQTVRRRVLQIRMQRSLDANGALHSIVGTGQDVTDLTLSHEPSALASLVAAIAHEINNPLAVVLAVLQSLPAGTAIDDALHAVERIRTTIADVNLYARGHTGSLGELHVEQVIATTFAQIPALERRATIVSRLQHTRAVRANATALGRVVRELIDNALDAVEGTATTEIHVASYSASGDWSVVEISDRGPGIPQAIQPYVCDPFFTTKGVGRRGLGLAIARGIVTNYGGSLTIHSSEKGTRVVVSLPASRRARNPRITRVEPPASDVRGRILIVDDEELFAKALSRLLTTDHEVALAPNGRVAFDMIQRGERFDVILCDVMMPEMTGLELRAALLEHAPEQAEHMIFVTGGSLDGATEHLFGGVETFEKPCDVSQLRAAIRRRLSSKG